MDQRTDEPISMLRYVLAYFGIRLAASGVLIAYALASESEPPDISTAITILAVSAPIFWFAKLVNRPMLGFEKMSFAIGNAGAELVLTIAWALVMFWLNNISIGWAGLDQILGGNGDPETAKVALVGGLTFGLLQVAFFSAFFGWLMTKNLPKEAFSNE